MISLWFLATFLQVDAVEDCGICLALNDWLPVERACDQCGGWRPSGQQPAASPAVDLRVTKALGLKGYDQIRVSVIQRNNGTALAPNLEELFQRQKGAAVSPFKLRWTHSSYYTRLLDYAEAAALPSPLRPSPLPQQGAGVAGILFGDPCAYDAWVGCEHSARFHTRNTTPALVNLFMADPNLSFYAILGDNMYDQSGEITAEFWNMLSQSTKTNILMTVPGNHDFWVQGGPLARLLWRKRQDQFGNGFAQWHMMDAISSQESSSDSAFNSAQVFDYSVDPDDISFPAYMTYNPIAHASNFFWYNQLGDVVFIGFSGAHGWETQREYFVDACRFVGTVQETTNWVVLLGHYDNTEALGGTFGTGGAMGTPVGYWKMATASCGVFEEYYARGRMKYMTGHTHCNVVNPHDHPRGAGTFSLEDHTTGYDGFLLGGMGMSDGSPLCGARNNYGMTVFATTPGRTNSSFSGDRLELVYFKVASQEDDAEIPYQFEAVRGCVSELGWRRCAATRPDLADIWLNVTAKPWNRALGRLGSSSHGNDEVLAI